MSCIKHYNLLVVGIAETHLTGNQVVGVEGYQWFGLNRRQIHVRAKTGSGGVGLLVRNDFTEQFNVRVVDDTTDGILWVEFEDKTCNRVAFYVCVIYLPPENSTRAVNVHEFLDTLMTQVYTIPHGNPFFLCGDWNSRCSDFVDFIPGIDLLPERQTVDYQYNMYGKLFTDFLVDINCCILNGRNMEYNDFTFISTRGSSVIDYCVVPYETLNCYEKFHVHRTSSMIEETGNKGRYDQSRIMPDHSLLTWNFVLNSNYEYKGVENPIQKEFIKYDVQNIPYDWLKSEIAVSEINRVISSLENSAASQCNINSMYNEFVDIIKAEMCSKLSYKKWCYKMDIGIKSENVRNRGGIIFSLKCGMMFVNLKVCGLKAKCAVKNRIFANNIFIKENVLIEKCKNLNVSIGLKFKMSLIVYVIILKNFGRELAR